MRRPEDLFDREAEWRELVRFARQPGPGIRLPAGVGGFCYPAVEEQRSQALTGLTRCWSTA